MLVFLGFIIHLITSLDKNRSKGFVFFLFFFSWEGSRVCVSQSNSSLQNYHAHIRKLKYYLMVAVLLALKIKMSISNQQYARFYLVVNSQSAVIAYLHVFIIIIGLHLLFYVLYYWYF